MRDTVTSVGQRELVEVNGRTYVLRPISYGEAAGLAADEAAEFQGGPAVLAEIVCDALRERFAEDPRLGDFVGAVEAHEDAAAAITALLIVQSHPEETSEAKAAWQRSWAEAQLVHQRAFRRWQGVEARVADMPAVRSARTAADRANWQRMRALVRLSLVEASGEGIAAGTLPAVDDLPAAEVRALYERANGLLRPGVLAGKI
jgi:hypothetical protein